MIVTRDFRIQLHPSMVDGTGMIPGVGDRVWGRMYIADLNKAYIRCEWELRLVGTWDNDAYVETDIAGPPSTWGQGRSRRPGRPLAAGWVGYMMVVRDKATHRLRIAPPADVPKDEWIRRGVFNPSILATEPDQWSWLLSSPEADGFVADEVVAKDNWKALPDFVWRARRCDNDSLGHTTVHRWVVSLDLLFLRSTSDTLIILSITDECYHFLKRATLIYQLTESPAFSSSARPKSWR